MRGEIQRKVASVPYIWGIPTPESCFWGIYGINSKWLREKEFTWYLKGLFSKHQAGLMQRQWHLNTFGWKRNISTKLLKLSGKIKGISHTKQWLEWLWAFSSETIDDRKQWKIYWKHWRKDKQLSYQYLYSGKNIPQEYNQIEIFCDNKN